MGVQIRNNSLPEDISPFLLDDEIAQKSRTIDTPFGKAPSLQKAAFEKFVVAGHDVQLSACKTFRAGYFDLMWQRCDKAFYGIKKMLNVQDVEREFRSNVRVRYLYRQVESQTSKIMPALLGFDPPCSVFPNDENNETRELKARAIQKQLKYNMFQKQNALSIFYRWVKQGERLGLSPMKMYWDYKTRKTNIRRPISDPRTGKLRGVMRIETDDEYIVRDEPRNVVVDTRNFWWNPDAIDPEDLRYCFHEYYLPISYIQSSPLYQNTEELHPEMYDNREGQDYRQGNATKYLNTGEDLVKVCERWDENFLMCVSQGKLVRYRDNPFDSGELPFYFYRSTPVDDNFVGMGVIEPNLDLDEVANTILNQRLDNVHRIVHKMIFVGATAGFRGKTLRFRPGGVERMLDINQVKPFEFNDVTASAYIEQTSMVQMMDDMSGDPAFGRGESAGKRVSASEISVRSVGAGLRQEIKNWFAQHEIARMFKGMHSLEVQFGNPEKYYKIFGMDGKPFEFRHDEIFVNDSEFDYTLGGYLPNRMMDFQQFVTGLQIGKQIPGFIEKYNMDELVKIFNEKSNIRGSDRLLQKPGFVEAGYYRDPVEENKRMFLHGENIVVLPGEQHTKHIPVHAKLADVTDLPTMVKYIVRMHLDTHIQYLSQDNRAQGSIGGQQSAMRNNTLNALESDIAGVAENAAAGSAGTTLGGQNARNAPGVF